MAMELFYPAAWPSLRTIRHGLLAFLLAVLISLEIPDVSVVRAQEVPGLYADTQGGTGNSSWVSRLTNPFVSVFPGQEGIFPADRPQGFSFMAEGLYMNFRSDAQVFAQDVTTTNTTYFGFTLGTSSAGGNFQSVKPDRVKGLRVGLGYTLEDWDARVLYASFRADPQSQSDQAGPLQHVTTYFGFGTKTQTNPFAATAPFVPLNNYKAEAGFYANVWDFQAGYFIRLGQLSTARLFGGISYVETQNTLDGTGSSLSVNRRTTYRAWGPKIGLDLNCPLGRSGLSLRGEGAVGGLFGNQKLTIDNKAIGGSSVQFEDSNRQNITSLEAEAGIGYSFPSMELTLGYRVERYSTNNLSYIDVGASLINGSPVRTGDTSVAQYLEGGFLRLDMKL